MHDQVQLMALIANDSEVALDIKRGLHGEGAGRGKEALYQICLSASLGSAQRIVVLCVQHTHSGTLRHT
jgi:hypothetical protein